MARPCGTAVRDSVRAFLRSGATPFAHWHCEMGKTLKHALWRQVHRSAAGTLVLGGVARVCDAAWQDQRHRALRVAEGCHLVARVAVTPLSRARASTSRATSLLARHMILLARSRPPTITATPRTAPRTTPTSLTARREIPPAGRPPTADHSTTVVPPEPPRGGSGTGPVNKQSKAKQRASAAYGRGRVAN